MVCRVVHPTTFANRDDVVNALRGGCASVLEAAAMGGVQRAVDVLLSADGEPCKCALAELAPAVVIATCLCAALCMVVILWGVGWALPGDVWAGG